MLTSSPTADADRALLEALIPAVIEAGRAILAIRERGPVVETKADQSPVTEADRAAEAIILRVLAREAPDIPVLAEEEVAAGRIPTLGPVFIAVDALDGTKDFIRGGPDFTVNVGLIRNGRPAAGIVGAPALDTVWLGVVGAGAEKIDIAAEPPIRSPIAVREPPADGLDIVASRSHRTPETDGFIARFPGSRVVSAGSSLKLMMIAEGKADLYPRLGPTSQWDIAAGEAIVVAAGGQVVGVDGESVPYGRQPGDKPFLNPWFIASGGIDPLEDRNA